VLQDRNLKSDPNRPINQSARLTTHGLDHWSEWTAAVKYYDT